MADRQVNVGILGFGIVGSGAYHILTDNAEQIEQRAGCPLVVAKVADIDWERPRPCVVSPQQRTTDAMAVVDDPGIDIIVETIGGVGIAQDLVLAAIARGKSVVTSNKELMAKHGERILAAARDQGVDVQFEGSVCGAVPVIRSLKEGLEANRIRQIKGILNGTTNYILTRMTEDGMPFGAALAEAQSLGYAEQDPTADVEGIDATNKIAILASIAFGLRVPVGEVHREGISHITPTDIRYAGELGYVIKLLAVAKRGGNGKLEVHVSPCFVPRTHPLASVSNVFNAVFIEGHACDQIMLYGRGAGSLPTGSAVVSDVMDCARNIVRGAQGRVPCTCEGTATLKSLDEIETSAYLRMTVKDRPGVLGKTATILGEEGVSIKSVIQPEAGGERAEIVWLTYATTEHKLRAACRRLEETDVVEEIAAVIRVEG